MDPLAEAERLLSQPPQAPDFVDPTFPVQTALLEDKSKLIATLCTRRAAKSFTAIKRLLRAMYRHPGSSTLFIALTRESAKKIMWKDVAKVLNRTHRLRAKFNETDLTMTLPNGSVLYALGVDTTEEEKEKLLGQKYSEVAIDESASYSIDLHALVFGILKPAVADYRGAIILYGTPGNLTTGLFFELTKDQDPTTPHRWEKQGWSGHCWNTFANPYMVQNWTEEISDLKRDNPLVEETPLFKQHYLGLWVVDSTMLVYKYSAAKNAWDGVLPVFKSGRWHHILGVDTGWKASAFTLVAFHDHCRDLFVLESWKRRAMDITAMSEVVKHYQSKLSVESVVIDGANKQAVEQMNNRHGLPFQLETAQKRDKFDFIDLMNADAVQGRIKVSTAEWEKARIHEFTDAGRCGTPEYVSTEKCGLLRLEWSSLVIDERALKNLRKREEHPNCENHCADSTLYPWRSAYPYISKALPPAPPKLNTPEWYEAQLAKAKADEEAVMEEDFRENARRKKEDAEAERWY